MSRPPVRRSPARWLAVAALVGVTAVAGIVTASTLSGSEDRAASATVTTASTGSAARRPSRSSYVVKPGDVLSVIAERYGVSVERLQELNPDVDSRTLRPGTRLRLRR